MSEIVASLCVWRRRFEVITRVLGVFVSRCLFARSCLLDVWSCALRGLVGNWLLALPPEKSSELERHPPAGDLPTWLPS